MGRVKWYKVITSYPDKSSTRQIPRNVKKCALLPSCDPAAAANAEERAGPTTAALHLPSLTHCWQSSLSLLTWAGAAWTKNNPHWRVLCSCSEKLGCYERKSQTEDGNSFQQRCGWGKNRARSLIMFFQQWRSVSAIAIFRHMQVKWMQSHISVCPSVRCMIKLLLWILQSFHF